MVPSYASATLSNEYILVLDQALCWTLGIHKCISNGSSPKALTYARNTSPHLLLQPPYEDCQVFEGFMPCLFQCLSLLQSDCLCGLTLPSWSCMTLVHSSHHCGQGRGPSPNPRLISIALLYFPGPNLPWSRKECGNIWHCV